MTPEQARLLATAFVKRLYESGHPGFACVSNGDGAGAFQVCAGVADLRIMVEQLIAGMLQESDAHDDLCVACQEDRRRLKAALHALRTQIGPVHQHLH